ncbi:MAG: thioredoxin family protein, partial [Bacteroidales bacterium]|nr:thioredoxin family protein [Bacteroidales bacterium]
IRSIPTLLFFKNGELVHKIVGATNKQTIEEKLKSLLN